MPSFPRPFALLASLTLLTACQGEGQGLQPPPEKPPAGVGPALADLGPAPLAPLGTPVAGEAAYVPLERAYALDHAAWARQPAYAFAHGQAQGFAWRTKADWRRLAERVGGGYRFFYYAPDRPHPFFIRDAAGAYAFDDEGRLVGVYDPKGVPLPTPPEAAELAGRYLAHAANLAAAEREERFRIAPAVWSAQAPLVFRSHAAARYVAQTNPDWRAWRIRSRGRDLALVLDDAKLIRSAFIDPRPRPKPAPVVAPAPAAAAPTAAPAPKTAPAPAPRPAPAPPPSTPPPAAQAAPPEPQ